MAEPRRDWGSFLGVPGFENFPIQRYLRLGYGKVSKVTRSRWFRWAQGVYCNES